MQEELLHKRIKKEVKSAKDLKELEQKVYEIIGALDKDTKLAFVAGPITAQTKFGKNYNRYKLDILTEKIARIISHEAMLTLSCAITPYHLQKFSINNFYNMYDRISDTSTRLYLTGNWKNSKGAVGEFIRAKKRGIEIFEVRERLLWLPMWFRKISFIKL